MKILQQRAREYRISQGLTQKQVANQMDWEREHLTRVEMGRHTNLTASTLAALAKALGCSADYLLGLSDDPRPRL